MSQAEIRQVETSKGIVEYDSDMPVKALKGLFSGASENDIDLIMESLSMFVTKWPFKGKPSKVADWDNLRRSEFNAITRGVMEDLGSLGEE